MKYYRRGGQDHLIVKGTKTLFDRPWVSEDYDLKKVHVHNIYHSKAINRTGSIKEPKAPSCRERCIYFSIAIKATGSFSDF